MGPLVQVAARVHTTPQMYVRMCICVLQARCRCLERKAPMPKCESIPVAPEFIPSACEFIRKAPKCPQRGRFENDGLYHLGFYWNERALFRRPGSG
eukprot:1192447-Prorocentrum_minimum.AAC.2